MIDLQTITYILNKLNISIPEYFIKEELVRVFAEFSSERIVENPIVLQNLPKEKSRVLDVGCRYSLLPIQMASLGHEVYGIDILPYKRKHPNFHFYLADILKPPFKASFFDTIISVSTIEHIGLTRYGEKENHQGDVDTVKQIHKLLTKNGQFILTLPFGKAIDTRWYRVYDLKRLKELLKEFKVVEQTAFKEKNKYWFPADIKDAEIADSKDRARAMLYVKAVKIS